MGLPLKIAIGVVGLAALLTTGCSSGVGTDSVDPAADIASDSTRALELEITAADLQQIDATGQTVGIAWEMQTSVGEASPVLWLAVEPVEQTEITWSTDDGMKLYATTTALQAGATIEIASETQVTLSSSYIFENGAFAAGSAGPVDQVTVQVDTQGIYAFGLSAPVVVNGVRLEAPYGAVAASPNESISMAGTGNVFVFLTSEKTGTVLSQIPSNTLRIDMTNQTNASVVFDEPSATFHIT